MFAEKFDALMNIAEVSNSLLGRAVNMNPSHIGRLRSGTRPLPKKHEYLFSICLYLAEHIKKEYQINALQKLTQIGTSALSSVDSTAQYLEQWLSRQEQDTCAATGRLISGFSRVGDARPSAVCTAENASIPSPKFAPYLYGNAGKRKAVEQFFISVLQTEKPQTILLFSDENMAWLYEDSVFAVRWAELFTKVIQKGNRVKIIHTVYRDMNELLEAITKWLPIYMTGMIEPYYYPRLRDGIFRKTLFLAPKTAAVISSSVQQDTDGMLNLFITDGAALTALKTEFENYFTLCRPLMNIYSAKDAVSYEQAIFQLAETEENSVICSAVPPIFTMPENLVRKLSEEYKDDSVYLLWKRSLSVFLKNENNQQITLVVLNPESPSLSLDSLCPSMCGFSSDGISYSKEQYIEHIAYVKQLENKHKNLKLIFSDNISDETFLYVKEFSGVIMAKQNMPKTAFLIKEKNLVNSFWDYLKRNF